MTRQQKILSRVGESEVLAQLAEEAAELAQAALKLRRALDDKNPTCASSVEARAALLEELGDINCVMNVLGVSRMFPAAEYDDVIGCVATAKLRRWDERTK